jgi:Protein of unknown function (DUF2829)
MDFPEALRQCINGKQISNSNWKGHGAFIFAMPGYESIKVTESLSKGSGVSSGSNICLAPYLMRRNAAGVFVPYNVTNIDIFSSDWYVIGE